MKMRKVFNDAWLWTDFHWKPFGPEELREIIQQILCNYMVEEIDKKKTNIYCIKLFEQY